MRTDSVAVDNCVDPSPYILITAAKACKTNKPKKAVQSRPNYFIYAFILLHLNTTVA